MRCEYEKSSLPLLFIDEITFDSALLSLASHILSARTGERVLWGEKRERHDLRRKNLALKSIFSDETSSSTRHACGSFIRVLISRGEFELVSQQQLVYQPSYSDNAPW